MLSKLNSDISNQYGNQTKYKSRDGLVTGQTELLTQYGKEGL